MIVFSEKRKNPRADTSVPLRYMELSKASGPARGVLTKNLSAGGARFTIDRFISMGRRLVVEINLPSPKKPIRTISKVAWIRKTAKGDNYEVGNQFLYLTRQNKAALASYVENLAA